MTHVGVGIKIDLALATTQELRTVGVVKEEVDLIAESIHRIINTSPGERLHAPTFGSRIYEAVFEPNDLASITLAAFYTSNAIETFEPRVTVEEITPILSDTNPNGLKLEVIFRLRSNPEQLFLTATEVTG